MQIGGGYSVELTRTGMGLRLAPADEDPDGSGGFGRLQLDGSTFRRAFFKQAGELVVLAGGGTIDASSICFEDSAATSLHSDTGQGIHRDNFCRRKLPVAEHPNPPKPRAQAPSKR